MAPRRTHAFSLSAGETATGSTSTIAAIPVVDAGRSRNRIHPNATAISANPISHMPARPGAARGDEATCSGAVTGAGDGVGVDAGVGTLASSGLISSTVATQR